MVTASKKPEDHVTRQDRAVPHQASAPATTITTPAVMVADRKIDDDADQQSEGINTHSNSLNQFFKRGIQTLSEKLDVGHDLAG
jgi:hypothetical protein